jgi:hypothetical protein
MDWTEDSSITAVEILTAAVTQTMTELEALEDAVRDEGVLIDGARGQRVANPALAAIARHRTMLAKLLAELEHPETQSQKAVRAARERWEKAKAPPPRERVFVPKIDHNES